MGQAVIMVRNIQGPTGGGGSGTLTGLSQDVVTSASSSGVVAATVEGIWGRSVASTAPSNGQVYVWSSTSNAWAPSSALGVQSFSGDVSASVTGSAAAITVTGLYGQSLSSTTPSAGQILEFTSSAWTPTSAPWVTTISGDVVVTSSSTSSSGVALTLTVEAFQGTPFNLNTYYNAVNGQVIAYMSTGAGFYACSTLVSVSGDVTGSGAVSILSGYGGYTYTSSVAVQVTGIWGNAIPNTSGAGASTFLEWTGTSFTWASVVGSSGGITQLTTDVVASGSGTVAASVRKLYGYALSSTAPTNAYVLTWSSGTSTWGPAANAAIASLSGDVTSSTLAGATANTVVKIQNVAVPAPSVTAGNPTYLSYNGSALSWAAVSTGGGGGFPGLYQDVSAPATGASTSSPATVTQLTGSGNVVSVIASNVTFVASAAPVISYAGTNAFAITTSSDMNITSSGVLTLTATGKDLTLDASDVLIEVGGGYTSYFNSTSAQITSGSLMAVNVGGVSAAQFTPTTAILSVGGTAWASVSTSNVLITSGGPLTMQPAASQDLVLAVNNSSGGNLSLTGIVGLSNGSGAASIFPPTGKAITSWVPWKIDGTVFYIPAAH